MVFAVAVRLATSPALARRSVPGFHRALLFPALMGLASSRSVSATNGMAAAGGAGAAADAPAGSEQAIVAGGCFWCTEAVFNRMKGVHSAVSGYIGGHTDKPTYKDICEGDTGHAEAVRVTYDPAVLTYRRVLEIFFATHDPTTLNRQGNDVGTQYRSAVFYLT